MKKTTIHDIARELDVTFSTVARALNDHPAISAATKAAVLETAKRLNYQQNKLASSLRSGRTNVIGIIVPSLDTSFFSSVVHGLEKVMNENGYSMLLYQTGESLSQEQKGIETFLQSRVDGIISSVSGEVEIKEFYEQISKRQVPLLFFDRAINELPVPSVTINDYRAGFLATEHLIGQGYKNIAHLTSDQNLTIFKERFRGYRDALQRYNLPVDEKMIFKGKLSLEFGKESVQQMLDKQMNFDAVFAAEDYTAMGALQLLLEKGYKVPEEIGIMGFANEAFGAFVTPSLSTVDQQTIRMGEETAHLFLKLIGSKDYYGTTPERIVLDPILLPRRSSQPD
ncbi:LacI family DNA-binding transcriptional regulator [Rufibacter sediminis]|uniref:LacI family DNA-binding transcriptional regulator n=1 Tax=Rufibacter sediminis TaxID=2762756 RepID=A0ABR6VNV8_9BACT|nr:LacI family DNA-binding transcriptional regulator [Rufibacter sediminis]MBC3538826.1 LacI family DNA-binding transcriptional regulator [Rufibacter sediminis]